ncbi:CdaR family protein [Rubrolithibacter danxiaensis]|uniref:CdaR family protein n=1 Tax=Rubrolithibacter danxiaensis TaxID=3390805 RepID=UPI003BF8DDA8
MPIFKLSRTEHYRLTLFIICLLVAIAAWLFFALSNRYTYTITANLQYINPPQNRAFHQLQPDTVTMQVEGTGWQMLFSNIHLQEKALEVDLRNLSRRNYITFTEQMRKINRQFEFNQHVISVSPDTLYFDFSSRAVKKVPVKLVYSLLFQKQYGVSGPIHLNPAYVTVTGPSEELKSIDSWKTDSLKVKKINTSINTSVALIPSEKANVSIYPQKVSVQIPVDELTEATMEIPVKVRGNPTREVRLLPEKVKLTYLVSLSAFNKLTPDDFEAVVNLQKWSEKKYKQLPVKLVQTPKYIKVIRMEPQIVDFIISEE